MLLENVTIRYFKKFRDESFSISDSVILAGPNNSGKTTLLQALVVWNLALRKWLSERGPDSGSKARKRTGVAITRKDFTAVPLREMNLLWHNRSTALLKEELSQEQKLGTPRILEVGLSGKHLDTDWQLKFQYTYRYPDLIHVRPCNDTPIEKVLSIVKEIGVIHVPPFSGIGVEETRYDAAYQDLLIGQGKPGDILRNLLLEIYREKKSDWNALVIHIQDIFGYELLPPIYEGVPFIHCEYQPGPVLRQNDRPLPKLDISTAGSGFLQVLMLLGFFYARPASILLLDEPDAHLHVILQKQVYDRLREIARSRGCQLLIATHSEILIDATSPDKILSFFSHPHKLEVDTEREQIREALKRLTSLDILHAELSDGVLYVEGESDLNLLQAWSRVLKHPASRFLDKPFWHNNQGRHPSEARAHFFALKAINIKLAGVLVLDGDNRRLPEHEISAEGLLVLRWQRYEAENYLLNPASLSRFVRTSTPDLFSEASAKSGLDFLRNELPPAVIENPLQEHDYLNVTAASKTLLPGFFQATEIRLSKKEYYQIASQMMPHEIHPEVEEKLDSIAKAFGLK